MGFCCCWVVWGLFVFPPLNNANIHFKDSKRGLPCVVPARLPHSSSSRDPSFGCIYAPKTAGRMSAVLHSSVLSARKASEHSASWDYTNTPAWGDGTARLLSLTVQLASTACVCLPGHVPKQSDFSEFHNHDFRWGLRVSISTWRGALQTQNSRGIWPESTEAAFTLSIH